MRIILLIMVLLSSSIVNRVAIPSENAVAVSRVTTSFDVRYTEAVLQKVSRLLSEGFKADQVRSLLREIDAMKAETPQAWTYSVIYKGKAHQLQIRALLDDLGMIDLDFATDPELAVPIRNAVDAYLGRRN
jgi:hypothetical protein